jgi:DNA-binding phage protein
MADYAWHPESKFENGDRNDTGITRRRHIEAVAVEYIGKEANRWEEQFYLGGMPESQIEYGPSAVGKRQLIRLIGRAEKKFGKAVLSEQARISRQQLAAVLAHDAEPRSQTVKALLRAITTLETEHSERLAFDSSEIELARTEAARTGAAEVARRLNYDVSNFMKVLSGAKKPSADLVRRIVACLGAMGKAPAQ